MKIVFLDVMTQFDYDGEFILHHAIGGTELATIQVAEKLTAYAQIYVANHRCQFKRTVNQVNYISVDQIPTPDIMIHLVTNKTLPLVKDHFPQTKHIVWWHSHLPDHIHKYADYYYETPCTIVAVSHYCAQYLKSALAKRISPLEKYVHITPIYNPIADDLVPDQTPVDPNKLIFLSSPHKGLKEVLKNFKMVHQKRPELKLFIANPGYFKPEQVPQEGVVMLGTLPYAEIIQHVRESLCVFYPQHTFEETFGLVVAQANAVGTPVIAHPLGALPEVVNGKFQLVDTLDINVIENLLFTWIDQKRPQMTGAPQFRLSQVAEEWIQQIHCL